MVLNAMNIKIKTSKGLSGPNEQNIIASVSSQDTVLYFWEYEQFSVL